MIEPQQLVNGQNIHLSDASIALAAIDNVLAICGQAHREKPNAALDYVLNELQVIKQAAIRAWPLTDRIKRQIDIGPFAAKNLEDWDEELAKVLMNLDYALQHDGSSIEKLLPLELSEATSDASFHRAYEELYRLASSYLRHDARQTLAPEDLVNETWVRLYGSVRSDKASSLHFRRTAGTAMRQVLVDAARHSRTQTTGTGQMQVSFDSSLNSIAPSRNEHELLALDSALNALSEVSPRQALLVEGRFFGGLSWAELAETLGISEATVLRDWRSARAWLAQELAAGSTGNMH